MKIAILSDIHGNSIALDAVLADITAQGGADQHWIVGDLVALGPDPVGVMERLHQLPNAHVVRGNTDRWLVDIHTHFPFPSPVEIAQQPDLVTGMATIRYAMVWTQGAVTATGDFAWIAGLPLEFRTQLPDGTRVLCVHAAPSTDDGNGIRPVMSDEEITASIAGAEADLIFVGHTHWALDRSVQQVRVVNLGSVSLQVHPDLRASYVWLEADTHGYHVQHRKVAYDHQRVVEMAQAVNHPALSIITAYMTGQRKPSWE